MNIMKTPYSLERFESNGNVLWFRNMASYIIDMWHSEKKENIEEEAKCIVCAAAKITSAEIRERV